MIGILSLDSTQAGCYKDFDEYVHCLTTAEILNISPEQLDFKKTYWNFTVYSPKRVAALYAYSKNPSQIVKQAFEENLPLVEICTGNYEKPLHIIVTPYVDIEYLKKKWCLEYCAFHYFLIKESFAEEEFSELGREDSKCMN